MQRFGPVRLFVASIVLFRSRGGCGLAPNIGSVDRVPRPRVSSPPISGSSQTLPLSSYRARSQQRDGDGR
jgi:hypothetical protein